MSEYIHHYSVRVEWTGNQGTGTSGHRSYSRDHENSVPGKPVIPGSSDPAFRGDPSRYNPEDLLVISLSSCHMLWYLHLCSDAGIIVEKYVDSAEGTLETSRSGAGQFKEVVLRPEITISGEFDENKARQLHERAHELCFIARSVNFPVRVESVFKTQAE